MVNGYLKDDIESTTTTLNGAIDSDDTAITLTDSSSFRGYGAILIDNELIFYTTNAANVLTCTRGKAGTTAASHSYGATV